VPGYYAYGLGIRSELPLPALRARKIKPDVVIRFAKRVCKTDALGQAGSSIRECGEEVCLQWKGAGRFHIRGGREITIEREAGAEEGILRVLLLGPALAVLLHQRGLLILHGSAILLQGAVVAFLGQKGIGKSTTAAKLHERGHPVVADDVIAVQMITGAPFAFPAYPQLNLWPDAASALGHNLSAVPKLHSRVEKRATHATKGFSANPLPLRLLYVLGRGTRNTATDLSPHEALTELLRHSYAAKLIRGSAAPIHFRQCASLVGAVRMRRLEVRPALSDLPAVARLIEEDTTR